MNGGKWTDEEIQFLRDNRDHMMVRELAQSLGRTYDATSSKLYSLCITRNTEGKEGKPFTWEEDEYIRKHFDETTLDDIARHIGRTERSVRKRANYHLGLKKAPKHQWTAEEYDLLDGPYTEEQVAEMTGRTLVGVRDAYYRNGIRRGKKWTHAHDEVLRRSWGKVPLGNICKALGRYSTDIRWRAKQLGLER